MHYIRDDADIYSERYCRLFSRIVSPTRSSYEPRCSSYRGGTCKYNARKDKQVIIIIFKCVAFRRLLWYLTTADKHLLYILYETSSSSSWGTLCCIDFTPRVHVWSRCSVVLHCEDATISFRTLASIYEYIGTRDDLHKDGGGGGKGSRARQVLKY